MNSDIRSIRSRRGFTIVELMVVVAIITLLMAILLPVLGRGRDAAKDALVLNGGRQLMVGYSVYQSEYREHVLFGYVPNAPNTINGKDVTAHEPLSGHTLNGQAVARYPARLLPYVGSIWEILQVQHNGPLIKPQPDDSYGDAFFKVYTLGVEPTFGINAAFVGGHRDFGGFTHLDGSNYAPSYQDSRIVYYGKQVRRPAQLVTFSTVGGLMLYGATGQLSRGFHTANSPKLSNNAIWTAQGQNFKPLFGASDFSVPRGFFLDQPSVAFFDGHVSRHSADVLNDMRLWSNTAQTADHDVFAP